jgi:hypothetical protein
MLNNQSVAYYTGKWFCIWTFKFFCVGIMAICAILVFFMACMPKDKDPD